MKPMNGSEGRPTRILLVEDSALQRRWLRKHLESDRVAIVEAADGLAGLDICRRDPPDLILLDLNMPRLRRVRDLAAPHGRAPYLRDPRDRRLGGERDGRQGPGLELGAVDYVTKPFDVVELKARVRVALRTKRPVTMT